MNFSDGYSHESLSDAIYFPSNVPTEDAAKLYDYDLEGCKCVANCNAEKECLCIQRSGTLYKYQNSKALESYQIIEKNEGKPSYECTKNCSCSGQFCGNRLVQFGPRNKLIVKSCHNDQKGLGLFTLENIQKGNFICEYAGEILTENEAKLRYTLYKNLGIVNYIFCIKETFGDKSLKTFIDPTKYGNIGRYINHSCEPNSKLIVMRVDDTIPILGIFANKDIAEDTEITYHYGNDNVEPGHSTTRKQCLCNSKNCQKYLPYDMGL